MKSTTRLYSCYAASLRILSYSFLLLTLLYNPNTTYAQDTLITIQNDTLLVTITEVNKQEVHYYRGSGSENSYLLYLSKVKAIYPMDATSGHYTNFRFYKSDMIADRKVDSTIYKDHSLYLNLLGNGSSVSLNFEFLTWEQPSFFLMSSIGIGFNRNNRDLPADSLGNLQVIESSGGILSNFPWGSSTYSSNTTNHNLSSSPSLYVSEGFFTIPHQMTINFGRNSSFLEAGLGGVAVFAPEVTNYYLYPIVGWRLHPRGKKFSLRLFASVPFSGISTKDIRWIPAGISIGIQL